MTPRDIEKLKAIGYDLTSLLRAEYRRILVNGDDAPHGEGWDAAKAHSRSPEGLKATMADKVRWLAENEEHGAGVLISAWSDTKFSAEFDHGDSEFEQGGSPEAAVDALFWRVP